VLRQLPRLSVLSLPGFPLTDAAAQQLCAMKELQQADLYAADLPACHLQHLPSSITQLLLLGGLSALESYCRLTSR
jgi:hypothetical protein